MLDRLKEMFQGAQAGRPPAVQSFEDRQLAAAALMVEAARLDGRFEAGERARIGDLLRTRFHLAEEDAEDLLGEAERASDESVQWQGFTQAIKEGFDQAERIALIEMLWEVVYADGQLHDYEASLLRRVAGLLYVPDRDSGEARRRVMDRLGIA